MIDDSNYSESIRKLTTASEQDDAVSAGEILRQLGPEQWEKATKDMIALNLKDYQNAVDNQRYDIFIPHLAVKLDTEGTSETLTVFQEPAFSMKDPLAVASVSDDIKGRVIENPLDPKSDLARQLTTSAEQGDAVATARIMRSLGPEQWGKISQEVLALNHDDIVNRGDAPRPPILRIGFQSKGMDQTIEIFQQPENQTSLPMAKVTKSRL